MSKNTANPNGVESIHDPRNLFLWNDAWAGLHYWVMIRRVRISQEDGAFHHDFHPTKNAKPDGIGFGAVKEMFDGLRPFNGMIRTLI